MLQIVPNSIRVCACKLFWTPPWVSLMRHRPESIERTGPLQVQEEVSVAYPWLSSTLIRGSGRDRYKPSL